MIYVKDDPQAQQTEAPPVIESEAIRQLRMAEASQIPSCRKVVKAVLPMPRLP